MASHDIKTVDGAIDFVQTLNDDDIEQLAGTCQCVVAYVKPNDAFVMAPEWISNTTPTNAEEELYVAGCFGIRCSFWPVAPLNAYFGVVNLNLLNVWQ